MEWDAYYKKFDEWATSTQISCLSALTSYGPSDEVAEVAQGLMDETAASRLIRRALAAGVQFTAEEICELVNCCNAAVMNALLENSLCTFTREQLEDLWGVVDDAVLEQTACRCRVKLFDDDEEEEEEEDDEPEQAEFPPPKRRREPKLGFWTLLGAALLGAPGTAGAAPATVHTVRRTSAIATAAGIMVTAMSTAANLAETAATVMTECIWEAHMNRTITIKGVGRLSLKPDQVAVSLSLDTIDPVYEKAMRAATAELAQLRAAIAGVGFAEDDLKTANFDIDTAYESDRDCDGNYRRRFVGCRVTHELKLELAYDTQRLSRTLGAIAACVAEPELTIRFTVKDRDGVNAALLESACVNAKQKAEILTRAAGVTLGTLLSIDYNWGELHLYSPTSCSVGSADLAVNTGAPAGMAIEPDDIDVSDSTVFVWEIR